MGKALLDVVNRLLEIKQCFALLPQVNFFANNLNFTEGDGIESRLSSYIFCTLKFIPQTKEETSLNVAFFLCQCHKNQSKFKSEVCPI